MAIPQHYAKYYERYIRFAVVMSIFALLTGIAYQESAKKAPFSELLPAGPHLESVFHLSLLHGHVFLLGVLIPMAVLAMMHFSLSLNRGTVSERLLKIGSTLYLPAATLAVLLMLYKGYHYLMAVRHGEFDFVVIEHTFFAGQEASRKLIYALVHIAMSTGLGILVIGVWRSLKAPATVQTEPATVQGK